MSCCGFKQRRSSSDLKLMWWRPRISLSGSSTCPRFQRICPRISLLRFLLQRMVRRSAQMTGLRTVNLASKNRFLEEKNFCFFFCFCCFINIPFILIKKGSWVPIFLSPLYGSCEADLLGACVDFCKYSYRHFWCNKRFCFLVLSRLLAVLAATEDLIRVLVFGQLGILCDFLIWEICCARTSRDCIC